MVFSSSLWRVKSPSNENDLLDELFKLVEADGTLHDLERTGEVRKPGDQSYRILMLRRFLVAEKMDVGKAHSRLQKHAHWRLRELPDGRIAEEEVSSQIVQQKVLLQPVGKDGRPLLVIKVAKHLPSPVTAQEVEKFVVFCLEAASRACDHEDSQDAKLWAIFDLNGIRWANLDNHALHSCFHLLQQHFPERVKRIFMLDSPIIFDALWRIVRPFVDPETRKKVQFVYGQSGLGEILKTIDSNILPLNYGGLAPEIPAELAARGIWERNENGNENGKLINSAVNGANSNVQQNLQEEEDFSEAAA